MSDIVERLRLCGRPVPHLGLDKPGKLANEAAAEIERLRAERDEARAACAGMMHSLEWIAESHDAGRHDGLSEPCPVHDADTMFAIASQTLANTTLGADVLALVEAAREWHYAKDLSDGFAKSRRLAEAVAALDAKEHEHAPAEEKGA